MIVRSDMITDGRVPVWIGNVGLYSDEMHELTPRGLRIILFRHTCVATDRTTQTYAWLEQICNGDNKMTMLITIALFFELSSELSRLAFITFVLRAIANDV